MAPHSPLNRAFHQFLDSGDGTDLAAVFDLSAPALLRQAVAAGLTPEAAEDVVQETFVVIMERRERFVPGAPFLPWASGIVVRQIRAEKRRRARALQFLGERGPDPAEAVESDNIASEEVRRVIERCLGTLPESNREVVRLSLFEGLSAGAIADRMSLSPGATSVRLHRGRKELREKLESNAGALGAGVLSVPTADFGMRAHDMLGTVAGTSVPKKSALAGLASGWTYGLVAGVLAAAGALAIWWPSTGSAATRPAGVPSKQEQQKPADPPVTRGALARDEGANTSERVGAADADPAAPMLNYAGRVLAHGGHAAGAGVEIFAIRADPGIVLPTEPLRPVAVTDPDGAFSIPETKLPAGGDRWTLLARTARGDEPMQTGWTDVSRSPSGEGTDEGAGESNAPLTITLGTQFFAELRIEDELGRPVGGAQLSALSTYARFFRYPTPSEVERGYIPVRPYQYLFGAESNDLGRARIDGLFRAPDEGTIGIFTAWKPGHASATVAMDIDGTPSLERTLVLRSLTSLQCSGVVTGASGAPLHGVGISFRARGEFEVSEEPVLQTSIDGSWALPPSLLGEYPMEIVFSKDGYARTSVSFQESRELPGEAIVVQMTESRPFLGVLVDAEGEPVEGVTVHCGVGATTRTAQTDASGSFGWTDLQDGAIALSILGNNASGERIGAKFLTEERGAEQTFVLPGPTSTSPFSCIVEGGDALTRASLTAVDVPGFEGEWALAPGPGASFGWSEVPCGSWVLSAKTASGLSIIQNVQVSPNAPAEEFLIPAPVGGSVQVSIASSNEWPPESLGKLATIRAERLPFAELPAWLRSASRSPSDSVAMSFPTDTPVSIKDLSPGTWGVAVTGQGWSAKHAVLEIRPGALTRIHVTAVKATKVRVALPPLGGPGWCTVQFRQSEDSPWIVHDIQSVSPDGYECAETSLPPGKWQWKASILTFLGGESVVHQRPPVMGAVEIPAKDEFVFAPWGED